MFKLHYLKSCLTSLFIIVSSLVISQCPDVNPSFTIANTEFCGVGPHSLVITNTSTGPNSNVAAYEWYVDGVLEETINGTGSPNLSVTGVNIYDIEMVVLGGPPPCTESIIQTVEVLPGIIADFNFAPDNDCAGEVINFTNTSTNVPAGATFDWDFGDGNTSTSENPTHSYTTGGVFTVSFTVSSPGCSDVFTDNITVLAAPFATISADNVSNCIGTLDPTTVQEVNFTNFTTGGVSYSWDFGDGNTSTDFEPTHNYTNYGTFNAVMTATGANGCEAKDSIEIIFERFVSAEISLPANERGGCVPYSFSNLVNNSVNATEFEWDFGDGTVITTTSPVPPTHVYNTPGNYTLGLTASNSCNTSNTTISPIEIVDVPNTDFTASTYNACAPVTITFNNTTTGAAPSNNHNWDMGNGNTYANLLSPPAQNYDTAGVYTVSLTSSNACGSSIRERDIIVDTIPIADFLADPIEGCSPLEVDIDNLSTGNITTYRWYRSDVVGNFEGVWTYNQNVGPITYTIPPGNNPITRNIRLRVSNACGFTEVDQDIIVHPPNQANFSASSLNVCVGDTVTFTDNSLGESRIYEWDFGEGTTATLDGPFEIEYNTPGTYTVQLVVDGYCDPDTMERIIEVNPYPVVDFTADIDEGCQDLDVLFTNNSTVSANMNWDFGTGASPVSSNVYSPDTITFNAVGEQTVYLTATENGCTTIDSLPIEVFPLPDVNFVTDVTQGCSPLDVAITNNSIDAGGNVYEWDFDNGNSFTGYSPANETFLTSGTNSDYDINLLVTNTDGCQDSLQRTITVYPEPVADFDFVEDQLCSNVAFEVTNNSVGGTNYDWDFDDGTTSADFEPTYEYASDGTYEVTLVVSSGFGCLDSITKNILIDPIPTADFSNTTVCSGFDTDFTDESTNGPVNYSWNFGDGSPLVTTPNPSYTYPSGGSYDVLLTVENSIGCADSIEQNVTVYTPPVADFDVTDLCLNDITTFTNLSVGNSGTINNYEWDLGDGTSSTSVNPTHSYGAISLYDVSLIVQDDLGCRDTSETQIEVTGIPDADFSFTEECLNDTSVFNDLSTGGPDAFEWDFGDGSPTETDQNPTHVFPADGNYQVVLVSSYTSSGCADTATYNVSVYPRTIPDFDAVPVCFTFETDFTDLTANSPTNWSWEFDDPALGTSSVQNPTYTYGQPDNYDVKLITENAFGCIDSIVKEVIVHPLPEPDFTFDTVCLNTSSQIIDQSTGASDWFYDLGDGNVISGTDSPFYTYSTSGTFDINQIVTNSFGCQDSLEQTITVNPNPSADFTADEACFSYLTSFTDASSADAEVWDWEFDDGGSSSTIQNPTYTFSSDGTFDVSLTVFNEFGCQDEQIEIVTVLPNPTAQFDNSTVCADGEVDFTNTSLGSPIDFEWDFGDGSTGATSENPSHLFPSGGSYDVTFIVENNVGCSDTIVEPVSVFTVPTVDFSAETVCLGNTTNFDNLSADTAPLDTFYWDFGDGNQSDSENPNYIYETSGDFDVTLIAVNDFGCSDTIVQNYTVAEIPEADFDFQLACLDEPIVFNDQSTASPIEWTWNFGDGTIVDGSPTVEHIYNIPGSYVVTLFVESAGGDCNDQISSTITVDGLASVFDVPDEVCSYTTFDFSSGSVSSEGDSISYYWSMGDGSEYNSASGTHEYQEPGVYEVSLFVESEYGCDETVKEINVISCTDLVIPEVFTPNNDGANDFFQLLNLEFYTCVNVEIFNRWGTLVYESDCYDNSWDGTSISPYNVGGDELPESTYYYLVTISEEDNNGEEEVLKGYVYLKR